MLEKTKSTGDDGNCVKNPLPANQEESVSGGGTLLVPAGEAVRSGQLMSMDKETAR